jgi:SAM-dependent methyltransferase
MQSAAFLDALREVIGDPVDRTAVRFDGSTIHAASGDYPIVANVPAMAVSDAVLDHTYGPRSLRAWKVVQAAGEEAYAKGPVGNFSVAAWEPAAECGRLLRAAIGTGKRVLDVGCGLLPTPAYMPAAGEQRFIGVDPMMGTEPRAFPFVQCYGDFLPFRRETFDAVQFISSLDHMLHPGKALRDAWEILKPGGTLLVEETIRRRDRPYWKWRIKSLRGPARFNLFHNYAFTEGSLCRAIARAGFRGGRIVPTSEVREVCVVARKPA